MIMKSNKVVHFDGKQEGGGQNKLGLMRPDDLELEEEYKRTEESDEGSEDSDIGISIMDYCW